MLGFRRRQHEVQWKQVPEASDHKRGAGSPGCWMRDLAGPPFTTLTHSSSHCLNLVLPFLDLSPQKVPDSSETTDYQAAFVWEGGTMGLLQDTLLPSCQRASSLPPGHFQLGVPRPAFCPCHPVRSLRAAHAGRHRPDVQHCQKQGVPAVREAF